MTSGWQVGSSIYDKLAVMQAQNADQVRNGHTPRYQARFRFSMNGKDNSKTCLEANTCSPIGGYNVWSSLAKPLSSDNPNVIMVVTGMDATAMLHDRAVGADRAVSGTVALLGAAATIATGVSAKDRVSLPSSIVFAWFNGEAYDLIGSRSFVQDLTAFSCNSNSGGGCANPIRIDTAFTSIPLNAVSSLIEVQQVGPSSTPLYVHTSSSNPGSSAISQALRSGGLARSSSAGLPPSSSWAFPSSIPSAVLSGFDSKFASSFYDSEFDNVVSDDVVDGACTAATVTARAALSLAGYAGPLVSANCTLVGALFACLARDGFDNCSIAASVLPRYAIQNSLRSLSGRISHYPGVYQGLSDPNAVFDAPRLIHQWLQSIGFTETHYHDALDPDIRFDVGKGVWKVMGEASSIWTESVWTTLDARLFLAEAAGAGLALFGAGVGVAAVAVLASRSLTRLVDTRQKAAA